MPRPVRQTERMHFGRVSTAGARYFVTFVTERRTPWLATPTSCAVVLGALRRWHAEHSGTVLIASVLPDHAHVLFELAAGFKVGQAVARWKSETRKSLGYLHAFQRDFWEHRLREAEAIEDFALYIFLNPYRAGLIRADATWPGSWTPQPRLFSFTESLTTGGGPPQEWVDWPAARFAGLAHGE